MNAEKILGISTLGLRRRLWLQRFPILVSAIPLASATTSLEAKRTAHVFDPVKPGRVLSFPRDHGAHLNYRTEWWYVTGFLSPHIGSSEKRSGETISNETLGFQLTFFRSATGEAADSPSRFAPKQLLFAHAALAIKSHGKLLHEQVVLRHGFERLTTLSETDASVRVLQWSLKRDANIAVQNPIAQNPTAQNTLAVERYQIDVLTPSFDLSLSLNAPTRPALQGLRGFSQKGPSIQQSSHYYSRPQLQVMGQVKIKAGQERSKSGLRNSKDEQACAGRAWMDHEWSNEVLDENAAGWDWVGLNFDNGFSLMAFQIRPRLGGEAIWCEARGFTPQGEEDFTMEADMPVLARRQVIAFKAKRYWRSLRSNALYPVELDLELQRSNRGEASRGETSSNNGTGTGTGTGSSTGPGTSSGKRILSLRPLMDDQEIDGRGSTGGFYWEGLVYVFENQRKIGQGYLELTGYAAPMKL